MAVKRPISVDFWTDDKVVDLFSPEDKYFMMYLLTNPHTTQLGIYKLNIKYAAFETGYSVETIKSLIERFEKHLGIIYYSPDTGEIAVKNYLIHSIVKGGKPVADLLWKEINDVDNKDLILMVFNHIKDSDKINKTVKNIIDIYMYKYINENENENHKSYPLSYHESLDESLDDSYHVPQQPIITFILDNEQQYIIYQHQIDEWKEMYPDIDVLQELNNIQKHCNSNIKNRKNSTEILHFIDSWLRKEQSWKKPQKYGKQGR